MSTSTRSWGCSDWSILALTCRGQMLNEPLSESRDAGNPPVRFDERDLETGLRATAPDLDSTQAKALVRFSRYGAAQAAALLLALGQHLGDLCVLLCGPAAGSLTNRAETP